ncbi:monovalent cation/H+ antiporter complex subunit F [Mammaliicoccus stepanovicii]|uniref:Putative monovalent cation/H+ antiporter subunit F n=1 Tax=Mammaliicoccus stepanovicii TaxID=643214 RepID=A0A239YFF2_9STAP|nr:monovalent cation/H+ antiporter complex subunit F [Mammaliicoccus stepanovicii]PNZ75836.1 cation:proton antiporter [Mammaliicoccus stepanovicii]GGI42723.1 putative antiporter subunit mnhF2 [Mammaliicoccus stepanovicii]SNV57146.1 putative monovalent cation/H+ antiporter subunit F [Mammaliicoccus stepanovicii]
MMSVIILTIIKTALVIYGIAIVVVLLRTIFGPTTADRVIAFDTIGAILVSVVGILSIIYGTLSYLEASLIIAILSFLSTVGISHFIEGGRVFESKRDR